MKKTIIIGSGAGGATAAKELQGRFDVMVIEAGRQFHPFTFNLSIIEKLKKTGILFNERLIQLLFPPMKITKAEDRMVLVKGICYGGSTTISAGNAVRMDSELKKIGIDLDAEFKEMEQEIPVSFDHRKKWHEYTSQAFEICRDMGLNPVVTRKMLDHDHCTGCGKCILGCPRGAKWDSRRFLNQALKKGARLIAGHKVQKVAVENGRATGVIARNGLNSRFFPADLVVAAAGGFGTPIILQNSGIKCEDKLFVDPVLCVAARMDKSRQNWEIPMPFIIQQEHFIISPYFDFLSFFFNSNWHYPAGSIYSLMVKLADSNTGSVTNRGIKKPLTGLDKERMKSGLEICKQIFHKLGRKDSELFMGTINAGHPGGMLPLTETEAGTLHHSRLPENFYISDATLFPHSLGNPPIFTIIALAKRISKKCLEQA